MRALLSAALVCALILNTVPGAAQVPGQQKPPPQQQLAPMNQVQPAPVPSPAASAQTPPATAAAAPTARAVTVPAGLNLTNASLIEVIDILARDLHINYILAPGVKGTVTINTYGEMRAVDVRNLLETILRMNNLSMVQVGNVFRIVPSADATHLPVSPQSDAREFGESEQVVLNLIFLKFVTSSEMEKLLKPFIGEGATLVSYDPANLLMIQDNSRNMKRTLDLINMFDSESIAGQRVRSFTLVNGRPSDVAKELENIFKAYSMSDKTAVKFIPIDRISTIISVVSNPAAFKDVASWIEKLDVAVMRTAGAIDNHVYKLKYGRAEILGGVIAQLYGASIPQGMGGYGLTGYGGYNRGTLGGGGFGGSFGGAGGGGTGFGGGYGGNSNGSSGFTLSGGSSAFGSGNGGANAYQSGGGGNFAGNAAALNGQPQGAAGTGPSVTNTPFGGSVTPGSNQTGEYLGPDSSGRNSGAPRIIPNPYDNTLLVQGTPQQWESISRLLEQLDVPPRQVLIDTKIYEVELQGQFQYGVEASLQAKDKTNRQLLGGYNGLGTSVIGSGLATALSGGVTLTSGLLIGHSRELLAAVQAAESRSLAKSISAPQIIATDSIPASITVGEEVPTLSATSVAPGFGGVTTSAIQNVGTGVNLNVIARVNSSGVVTLVVDQDISAPQPTQSGLGVSGSPSFSRRNISTQITIEDGDTIAIAGIIEESKTLSTGGIPILDRIPWIGGVFGSKSYNTNRTELIVFLTPRVIYDTNGIADATEEVRSRMRLLKKETGRP